MNKRDIELAVNCLFWLWCHCMRDTLTYSLPQSRRQHETGPKLLSSFVHLPIYHSERLSNLPAVLIPICTAQHQSFRAWRCRKNLSCLPLSWVAWFQFALMWSLPRFDRNWVQKSGLCLRSKKWAYGVAKRSRRRTISVKVKCSANDRQNAFQSVKLKQWVEIETIAGSERKFAPFNQVQLD